MKIKLRPARYTKKAIAERMVHRGRLFLLSAILLSKHSGSNEVVLHLVGQSIEIILKGCLLMANFDKYQPKLRDKYGHKLEEIVNDVMKEFKRKGLSTEELKQLRALDQYYRSHNLRYSGVHDMLHSPANLEWDLLARKMLAVLRLAYRHERNATNQQHITS